MELVRMLVLTVIFTVITLGNAFAINLTPGDYKITSWIESPAGGIGSIQKRVEHVRDAEADFTKMFTIERCKLLSKNMTANTLTFELACEFPPPSISGNFSFNGDSFEGRLRYGYKNEVMNVGMRGTRIDTAAEPNLQSGERQAEIDKKLQELWAKMKSYLASGDVGNALELFHPDKREKWRTIFEEAKKQNILPVVVSDMVSLNLIRIDDDHDEAIYRLRAIVDGQRTGSQVVFQKDQSDNWYIVDF